MVRFVIVGVINTALDFGILLTLKHLGLDALIANIISTSVAFVFSFFANKKYTFQTTDTNVVKEMVLFVIVTLSGLWLLQTFIIWFTLPLTTSLLHTTSIALVASKLIATLASLTWNYILYAKIVFIKH